MVDCALLSLLCSWRNVCVGRCWNSFELAYDQINERVACTARLVDSLLRGRAQASAHHEASAAVSDVRTFVRAWRPSAAGAEAKPAPRDEENASERGRGDQRPSPDVLLKLAQVRDIP